jgi:kynurenine--oxoglutarate transaminase/cysteine-S-conjugate beta-lyase/glutamine--phenylpyruvate transaminase
MFEPFFDLYLKQIKLTGATPRFVALGGGGSATAEDPWALDLAALEASITPKTRVLILNSPHNPTGKVFSRAELEAVAEVVRRHPRLVVLSDEVYKFSVYDAREPGDPTSEGHYHFARLPGMFDRTLTLSSCGKTFSVTGWQVGWMVGPARLVKPVQDLLPCVQFCASTPMQHALYTALQSAELPYEGHPSYYAWLRAQFASKRAILEEGLVAAGMTPLPSSGGFFLMARLPLLPESVLPAGKGAEAAEDYDWRYCRMLARDYGVIGIPASPFFARNSAAAARAGPLARFAFCKKDDTLREARRRLQNPNPKR